MDLRKQILWFGCAARLSVLAALLGFSLPGVAAPTLDPSDGSNVSGPVEAIEFYNAALDHYFLSIDPQEVGDLDLGVHAGWTRTGQSFAVFGDLDPGAETSANPVCRFYIPPAHGDSHFLSADPVECNLVLDKMQNDPNFSGYVQETPHAFYAVLSDLITGDCPSATTPVYRLWNRRWDSNHRYTASQEIKTQMIAAGYVAEGRGPNAVAMCAAGPVKTARVVVVPLRYQSPPSTDPAAIAAHNATLPQVTQADAQVSFAKIAAWWNVETYGLQKLDVSVLPAVELPGSPVCDLGKIISDADAAVNAAGAAYDVLVAITPYACWQSHMITTGNKVVSWNTFTNALGELAHELGHAFGLRHNALRMPDYVEYGSGVDQMGSLSNVLLHFLADHKEMLGVLRPKPCASATLRSIYQFPDAIRCGAYVADYLGDWSQVWIHKREFAYSGTYGGSDTTDVAKLSAGQSYSADGYTFTHIGGGKVKVVAP